ncbi:MAG: PspC domain-containing protein [Bacteroides sp.]|nr:PspC domain-containing protein [Bacteroides sp.]MCM1095779.1 PspC domain-containing protein [Terasakiella sp.]
MKKAFPANINGSIFYIDEDAYRLLNTYLDQMRKAFPGAEGEEIAGDIESRVGEHFTERINAGARVIVLSDVNTVIEAVGRPADIASDVDVDIDADTAADDSARQKPSDTKEPPVGTAPRGEQAPPPYHDATVSKRLYRDERYKVFGGVFAGLGVYLGWNANIMRVLYIILAFSTHLWPCTVLYFVAWMVIPPARTPRQILEMTGQPVTPGSVGRTILGTADPTAPVGGGTSIPAILGKILLGFFGLVAGCIGMGALVVMLVMVSALVVFLSVGTSEALAILSTFDFNPTISIGAGTAFGVTLTLSILIPCVALIWAACCALFNARSASRTTMIITAIIEILLIVASIVIYNVSVVPALYSAATAVSMLPLPFIS